MSTIAKIIVKSGYIMNLKHAANLIDYAANKIEACLLHLEDGTIKTIDEEVYVAYIATRPSVENAVGRQHGLFTLEGDADLVLEQRRLKEHRDSIKWSQIISLGREDAERTGYDNRRAWQTLIRAKAADIAKTYNIDLKHLVVNAAYHDKDYHPHVHLLFYSTDSREGHVADMTKASERLKSLFFNQIFQEDVVNLKEQKTELRRELDNALEASLKRVYAKSYAPPDQLAGMLVELSKKLDDLPGKKVYGFLPPGVKKEVSNILRYCIENDPQIKKIYARCADAQREFIRQYVDDPEKIEKRMADFEAGILSPGKYGSTRLHNIILRSAAALGCDPPQPGEMAVQKENEFPDPGDAEDIPPMPDDPPDEITVQKENEAFGPGADALPDALDRLLQQAEKGDGWAAYSAAKMFRDGDGAPKDSARADACFAQAFQAFRLMERQSGNDRVQYRLGSMLRRGEGCAKDIGRAVEYFTRSAGQGNPYAQYALGKMVLEGKEIDRNAEKGVGLLQKAATQGNAAAQYTLGRLYLEGKEVKRSGLTARSLLEASVNGGNAFAAYTLGQMYKDGNGVDPDAKRSDEYFCIAFAGFQKLEEKTHLDTVQARLGKMLFTGTGTEPDEEKAVAWLEKAMAQGNTNAEYELARHRLSVGDPGQAVAALDLIQDAAARGNATAQYFLGKLYEKGEQVPKDVPRACAYFKCAAALGNPYAQYKLGKLYLQGEEVAPDQRAALAYLEASAAQGNSFAQYTLGRLYMKGEVAAKNIPQALFLLRRSAEKDNDHAQYTLGKMYLEGTDVPKNPEAAFALLNKSAGRGNEFAQYRLGKELIDGGNFRQDVPAGLHWLTESAAQNNQYAQYTLGQSYLRGEGVPKDRRRAAEYFTLSANQGNLSAQYMLSTMNDGRREKQAAYVAALLIRELAYSLGQEARQTQSLQEKASGRYQGRQKFTYHVKQQTKQQNYSADISY